MSLKDKREQAESIRRNVINIVIEEVVQNGYQNVKMRSVASRADISLPVLYKLFGSKEEMLAGAVEHVGERFYHDLSVQTKKAAHHWGAWGKIVHYGYNYVLFSIVNRQLFEFFSAFASQLEIHESSNFLLNASLESSGLLKRTFWDLNALVTECEKDGQIQGNPEVTSYMLWVYIHGMAGLISSAIDEGEIEETFLEMIIEAFLKFGLLILTREFLDNKIHLEIQEWIVKQFSGLKDKIQTGQKEK